MTAPTLREHLSKIRDGFRKIETITLQLGAQPRQEDLERALRAREAILSSEVDTLALELSAAYPDWHTLAKSDSELMGLVSEAEELTRSIMRMDERISFVVSQRMESISTKLSSLYRTSRAANFYIRQSTLRAAS